MKYSKLKKIFKRIRDLFFILIEDPVFRIGFLIIFITFLSMILIFIVEKGKNQNIKTFFDSFWYTIVTLTTTGYGDITPVTVMGRIVGIMIMAFGLVVIGSVSGRIASFLIDRQLKRGRGLLKLRNLKNHFIICGWRTDFENIIDGIIESINNLDRSDIVLINNTKQEYMEIFLSNPKYKIINYIQGDYIEESVLIRANIKLASKVLILADQSLPGSAIEVDSRTVMAVLTIKNLNKDVYVAAEIIDEKFEKYLTVADCDEVILTKEYVRKLLINASCGTGVSSVIRDLLSLENKKGIIISDIPPNFIGDNYKNLFDHFLNQKETILVGILENTGNFYNRKKEALNEAQKSPDISKIVDNLRKVKELKANNSILVPEFDYIVKKYSKAILIGKTDNF
ncbi:MAG: hypothetical protein A2086_00025 [Spirochaetes bacterium GWD1_27_9]|nr:MAG: hypothetical protein A2Z98_08460 [Spirochaetes bacterium GWB1_27_13]OHD21832.1 MAG: hypothetical protein A2Y34_12480 [Spirochaetes bacterium GWC1_27_15]OHD30028.1 MAG: hypothetical protein A2086_00025 [Spirochaetes bacterium GWD1_27_9]